MYIQITELEKDLLREIMNVGVSKAADAFALLTNNKEGIILTVPEVRIIRPEELPRGLTNYEEAVILIKTALQGDLQGVTLLLFFEQHIEWIMAHSFTEKELRHERFEDLQLSLLLEMSNILSGAILTQLSNILGLQVVGLPPVSLVPEPGKSIEQLLCEVPPCHPIVLSVRTDFMDRSLIIEFPLLLVLEISSLSRILNIIRQKGIYENQLLKRE